MAKKDERFEVGDLVRIIDEDTIRASQDLTLFKKYEVTEIADSNDPNERAKFFIIDDVGDRLGITPEEFGGIERVVKYSVLKGDRIRITHGKDRTSYYHAFSEGEVVTVLFVNSASITAEREETGTRQSIHHGDFEPEHMPSENDLDAAKRAAAELSDEERAKIARAYFESLSGDDQLDFINRALSEGGETEEVTDPLPDEPEAPKASKPNRRPKVGDRVKVTGCDNGHFYDIGKEYEITHDDGSQFLPFNLDGKHGAPNWIGEHELEVIEKIEDRKAPAKPKASKKASKKASPNRRPTVGDTVRIIGGESDHEYEIDSVRIIEQDDHDSLPYRMKGGWNFAKESDIEIVKYREE